MFSIGASNIRFTRYFTGNSYLNPLTKPRKSSVFLANMTFEPGCRNGWHIHHAGKGGGQILVCTAGSGWYQKEGRDAIGLEPGTAITIPAGIKHWHDTKADSWLSYITAEVPGTSTGSKWCEPVIDREYEKLP